MVENIPSGLISSMMLASLSFVLAIWLIIYFCNKNLSSSLKIGFGLGIWYVLVFVLGRIGFFGKILLGFIPLIAFGFLIVFLLIKFLLANNFFEKIFQNVPAYLLIAVQVFRVMGYGFISFHKLGLIPGEFALVTGWGDVIIGATALPIAYLLVKKNAKKLAVWWNYLGLTDLALALVLGISTYPRPVQLLPTTPDNSLIALFPLVMVPLFAVPLSIFLHLLTLRKIK